MRSKLQAEKTGRIKVSPKDERTLDGIAFASKSEMKRYAELKLLERVGTIKMLVRQPKFILQESFIHPVFGKQREISYIADFEYYENGRCVVEDVKGMKTEVYKLKRKLFLARYPEIDFREVK